MRLNNDTSEPLRCPRCDFEYTHQGDVTVWSRTEDAPVTIKNTVHGDGTVTLGAVRYQGDNPSSRRDGASIKFSCEGCGGAFEMTVAQHKGHTFIGWRSCAQ